MTHPRHHHFGGAIVVVLLAVIAYHYRAQISAWLDSVNAQATAPVAKLVTTEPTPSTADDSLDPGATMPTHPESSTSFSIGPFGLNFIAAASENVHLGHTDVGGNIANAEATALFRSSDPSAHNDGQGGENGQVKVFNWAGRYQGLKKLIL